ncbi:cysteine protease ATG4D [Diachasma alloeum]|uniref:cysteine protease ATG4D n=1 Tax=Diachasma alloeum TaxID=454923 RepID=UPI000738334F|nr:cysteine protease ATG4D [Diachasma alloeum]
MAFWDRLPEIPIKPFDGKRQDYPEWASTFPSIIRKKEKLDNVRKMQHLKGALRGEPAKLISNIDIDDNAFDIAWSILKSRYDIKRLLITAQLNKLRDPPPVKERKAAELHKLISDTTQATEALKSLGIPNDQWGPLIIHNVVRRLDKQTHALEAMEIETFKQVKPPPTQKGSTDKTTHQLIKSNQHAAKVMDASSSTKESWRWRPDQPIQTHQQFAEESKHRMIIKWFGDQPAAQSPFSIHSLVSLGASTGKRAGDWYGPASVAHLLSQAFKVAATRHEELENLSVYVAQDCAVYLEDVRRSCERSDGTWRSLVILVPLRLGADKLNSGYGPCLTALLSLEVCIGVIGGRPRHSLYFIGYQEDKLIHLDPHYCQETVDVWKHNFSLASFHCSSPRKMLLSKMDPSCCIGFYLHDKKSLESFIKIVQPFLVPPNQKVEYPMFLFCDGSGDEMRRGYSESPSTNTNLAQDTPCDDEHYECEEFELI